MAKNSSIGWTHHTFNPWWGCAKISPACTNCYASTFDHRLGGDHWGAKAPRRFFSDAHWIDPIKWNAAAERDGIRRRVFCASMADVFEDRDDLVPHRERLWRLIGECKALDWLLLTKRPENLHRFVPWAVGHAPWPNVWLGVTAENQEYADIRIPILLKTHAVVHFLSCEPLLGPVILERAWVRRGISWVIAGGESGARRRPTEVPWLRSLRNQCRSFGAAYFLKQAEIDSEDSFIAIGRGSMTKGQIIELPYLDGEQHASFPTVRASMHDRSTR